MAAVTETKTYNGTQDAADFVGLTAAERAELAEHGYRFEGLECLRFLDTRETYPWFYREHELLGYVFAVTDGGQPLDPEKVLKTAVETFGPCDVMWP